LAAQSIAFYIAEGSSRNKNQFVYYLKLAKSSLRECVVLTSVLEKQSAMTESMVEHSRNQLIELTKMIGALIGSLQKASRKYPDNNLSKEPESELEFVDQYSLRKY
jgi:four helix bundle protein